MYRPSWKYTDLCFVLTFTFEPQLYPDWDSKFPEEQQDAKGFLGYMMMDIHQWTLTPPDPGELRQFWVQPPDYKLGGQYDCSNRTVILIDIE